MQSADSCSVCKSEFRPAVAEAINRAYACTWCFGWPTCPKSSLPSSCRISLVAAIYIIFLPLAVIRLGRFSPNLGLPASDFWKNPVCLTYLTSQVSDTGICSWQALNNSFKTPLQVLENKRVALIGDSRIRHMFTYLKSLLDHRHFHYRDSFNDTAYLDHKRNISVDFYARWFPDDKTHSLLTAWNQERHKIPDYLFFESGAWPLFRYGPDGLATFRKNLTLVAKEFAVLRGHTTAIWMKTLPFHPNAESGHGTWIKMRNGSVSLEEYSATFEMIGRSHHIVMWTSAYDDAKSNLDKYMDHVHPGTALIRKALCQLLLAMEHKTCPSPKMSR